MPGLRLIVMLLPLLALGCAAVGGEVRVRPLQGDQTRVQRFGDVSIRRNPNGDYDIRAVSQDPAPPAGTVLQPLGRPPIRHELRIHLNWRPASGTRHQPGLVNASLLWEVRELGEEGRAGMIQYRGAGFVLLENRGRRVLVDVQNAQLELMRREGGLADPLSPATARGKLFARWDQGD